MGDCRRPGPPSSSHAWTSETTGIRRAGDSRWPGGHNERGSRQARHGQLGRILVVVGAALLLDTWLDVSMEVVAPLALILVGIWLVARRSRAA